MSDPTVKRSLPRRDWILLPLASILTVIVMMVLAEGMTRVAWPESKLDRCVALGGAVRPAANCVSVNKTAEGPWVEARYNNCGYRATGPCGPTPPGTMRLVALGSSTSWGELVQFDHAWSVEAARAITDKCRQPIDIQSLGGFGTFNDVAARLPEAIALHPQMAALVFGDRDLFEMPDGGFSPVSSSQTIAAEEDEPPGGIMDTAKALLKSSRAVTILQHFIFRDADTYVSMYLRAGDRAGFLRQPLSPEWQARLAYLDAAVGYITDGLKPTGAPLLVIFAPGLVQADMVGDKMKIPGVDAEALDRAIAAIAARHGAIFAGGASIFRGVKDAPNYFYRADGHYNDAGQALLGNAVARTVLSERLAGLCQEQSSR